jgi:hypothetical protein
MKFILSIAIIFSVLNTFAQLPTIVAESYGEKYIDWKAEEANVGEGDAGYFYNDCAQGVTPITASSTLAAGFRL